MYRLNSPTSSNLSMVAGHQSMGGNVQWNYALYQTQYLMIVNAHVPHLLTLEVGEMLLKKVAPIAHSHPLPSWVDRFHFVAYRLCSVAVHRKSVTRLAVKSLTYLANSTQRTLE